MWLTLLSGAHMCLWCESYWFCIFYFWAQSLFLDCSSYLKSYLKIIFTYSSLRFWHIYLWNIMVGFWNTYNTESLHPSPPKLLNAGMGSSSSSTLAGCLVQNSFINSKLPILMGITFTAWSVIITMKPSQQGNDTDPFYFPV